jgi:4-amino-4-deoxy-L-arabinose transferase-like glycosyltransferase
MTLVAISAILLIAVALRIYGIDYGFWYDEILTYVNYMGRSFGELLTIYDSENNHILFTILARVFLVIFDEKIWSIRLPAVLFGIGSIWALYLFGRQVGAAREALLSAAFLTFSYHHIWFSQNARGYTGLLFWTLIASWLFLYGLKKNHRIIWILYAVSVALGIYTHMNMIFVVIGHFIIYGISLFARKERKWSEDWKGLVFGFGAAGLLSLQLYAFVLPQVLNTIGEHSNVATWKNPLWTLVELAKGLKMSFAGSLVAFGALLLTAAGVLSFDRQKPVVLGLLFLPTLIGSAVVISMRHPLWPRFFFFAMGFGVLVIVRGTTILGRIIGGLFKLDLRKSDLIGTILCAALILISASSILRAYAPKQDYRGALSYIRHHRESRNAVVTVGLTKYPYKSFYKTDWKEVETIDQLNTIRIRANRTWLLYTLPFHLQAEYPEIMNSIKHDFKVVKKFYGTLNGGTIFVCLSD